MTPFPVNLSNMMTYSRHVALLVSRTSIGICCSWWANAWFFLPSTIQRKFIRETTTDLSKDLHKKFAEWVHTRYPTGLSEDDWATLVEADLQFSYSQTQPSLHAPLQDDTEVLVLEAGCVASEETIYDENESDNNETPLETGTQQVESLQRLLEQQSDFPATLQTELLEDARRLLQERARAAPPY